MILSRNYRYTLFNIKWKEDISLIFRRSRIRSLLNINAHNTSYNFHGTTVASGKASAGSAGNDTLESRKLPINPRISFLHAGTRSIRRAERGFACSIIPDSRGCDEGEGREKVEERKHGEVPSVIPEAERYASWLVLIAPSNVFNKRKTRRRG